MFITALFIIAKSRKLLNIQHTTYTHTHTQVCNTEISLHIYRMTKVKKKKKKLTISFTSKDIGNWNAQALLVGI